MTTGTHKKAHRCCRVTSMSPRIAGAASEEFARVALTSLTTRPEGKMSHTVSTLLLRNLHDVFGEIDPVRRRATIDEIFHEDAVFYDPNNGIYRGRDEIDRIAGVIKATHPDFRYQPIAEPDVSGDRGRGQWGSR